MGNKFGWSLPPGVTRLPGEEPDMPCSICCQMPDDCVCPACTVCGDYGNPKCYKPVLKEEVVDVPVVIGRGGAHVRKRVMRLKMRRDKDADSYHGQKLTKDQLIFRKSVLISRLAAKLKEERDDLERLMIVETPFAPAKDAAGLEYDPFDHWSDQLDHHEDPFNIKLTWE